MAPMRINLISTVYTGQLQGLYFCREVDSASVAGGSKSRAPNLGLEYFYMHIYINIQITACIYMCIYILCIHICRSKNPEVDLHLDPPRKVDLHVDPPRNLGYWLLLI